MAAEDSRVDSLSGCFWRVCLLGSAPQGRWAAAVGVLQTGCRCGGDSVGSEVLEAGFRGWFGAGSAPHCPGGVSPSGSLSPPFPPPRFPSVERLRISENKPG